MNNTAEHYEPVRDSIRTERERLTTSVTNLEKRLIDVDQRSRLGFDPAYSRTSTKIQKELIAARNRICLFDDKQARLNAARTGEAATTAQKEAQKAARDFEERLVAFAAAASTLKTKATVLADALQIRDPGIWPSIQSVDIAVRGRVIEVLGSAGIKFEGFGSSAKPSQPLSTRFESQQGK